MHPKRVFATVGALACLAALGAGVAWRNQLGPLSLNEELAAARSEGVPVDAEAMAEPPVPRSKDGTPAYLLAARLAKQDKEWCLRFHPIIGPVTKPTRIETLSSEKRAELRDLIAEQAKGLAALEQATKRGRITVSPNWRSPYGSGANDVESIRILTKTLVARAALRRIDGDLAGARADTLTLARTAALYFDRRTLTQGLTRIGIERESLRAAQEYAAARPRDPAAPALLREVVQALGPAPDIRRILSGEVLLSLHFIGASSQFQSAGLSRESMIRFAPVRDANLAHQVAYWRTVFRTLPQDPSDFDGARHALTTAANAYRDPSLRGIATSTHFREIDFLAQSVARRRIALATADALEQWQRTGSIPTALKNPPADPFGGDIHYLPHPMGITVYSYDRDGVDHGGGKRDLAAHISLP